MRIRAVPVAAAGSFLAITALVATTSSAAFTASTDNAGNSWTAGTLALSDDDSGTALFTSTAMRPAVEQSNCIAVTYNGTIAGGAPVTLHATTTGGLAPYLDLVVERGTGGGFGSCTGFTPTETAYTGTVAGFASAHSDFATGAGTWSPEPAGTATYRFRVTLRGEDAAQGLSSTAAFTWETQDG